MTKSSDRELGLRRRIRRRDFLNGVALTAATLAASPAVRYALALESADPEKRPGYNPAAKTGLRGSHEGSFEVAHSLRDGTFWETAGAAEDTGERYDLVVVGGGPSGLAAAHYYRGVAGARARVLILENHDDVGGHAKRNELTFQGRTVLTFGGGHAIDSPGPYSPVARALLETLGIDVSKTDQYHDPKFYASKGLSRGLFFDRETFGADRLVPDPLGDFGGEANDEPPPGRDPWPTFMTSAPLDPAARESFSRLCRKPEPYLAGLALAERRARLARTSYLAFLNDVARVHPQVTKSLQSRTHSLYGLGIDAVPALDAAELGLPGFGATELGEEARAPHVDAKGMARDPYFFHFPDGLASVARLLVRRLVPAALPGSTMEDVVTARLDYAKLDDAASSVRIRLNSTAVRVRHLGKPENSKGVEIAYVRHGKLETVRASHCVLACWNGVIPYLWSELPEAQARALSYGAKVPMVYTNVLIRDWTSWAKLGVCAVHAPGGYHSTVNLGRPTHIGQYRSASEPKEPMALHLVRAPCSPGLPARDQHRAGRIELLSTDFETFERNIREQLGRLLGGGGFDPARDIAAITVNRWPHGFAYEYNSLWDPFVLEGGETPCTVARRPLGRIAIANSDAAARAYLDAAFDEAYRAVGELLKGKPAPPKAPR